MAMLSVPKEILTMTSKRKPKNEYIFVKKSAVDSYWHDAFKVKAGSPEEAIARANEHRHISEGEWQLVTAVETYKVKRDFIVENV